ncbi:MAG: carbonic anhydrase [Clostridiales bacterium]|nr:carbonic anhydrase [Clostridiales bacterium]
MYHKIDINDAEAALRRLVEGNEEYRLAKSGRGNISEEIRHLTHTGGQKPYAIVISCSDSRVVPELMFMVGIGEIFTIRTAGNVIGDYELGSIEYAAEHLGVRLVLVVGHTVCGAVESAMNGGAGGSIKHITDEIKKAIGDEKDPVLCEKLNVENSLKIIENSPVIRELEEKEGLIVAGGHYNNRSGKFTLYNKDLLEKR